MRKLITFVAGGLLAATAAGCGSSEPWSPSDPKTFDRSMIDTSQLAGLSMPKRAYVEGHAIGVYLMGKTLPQELTGHHYMYWPGISSPHAEVAYKWSDIMIAVSGGYDGNGSTTDTSQSGQTGVIHDDVGGGSGSGNDPGSGGGSGSGSGSGSGDGCGVINAQCSYFLSPAANHAGDLAAQVDPHKFTDPGLSAAQTDQFIQEFELGMKHALSLPSTGTWGDASEVTQVQNVALEVGMCQQPIPPVIN